ncbi:Fc receptor-like protein 4 [Phasianus colchicus]|uniref:Fc receptor-like protein 4 n=1 Tax=Phasianus colchicus TaxID=9054 RepID=UPI00129DD11E|nr:Fc receptor-like protein 4 [Phasianus colchicus]
MLCYGVVGAARRCSGTWQTSPSPNEGSRPRAGNCRRAAWGFSPHLFLLVAAQALGLAVTEMALLTMDPPWSVIFQGESVTLRCHGPRVHGQQPTAWYHNNKLLEHTETNTYRIQNARYKENGRYECQSSGSTSSNSITLSVSYDLLILQVPSHAVFEGELLQMRCRGWKAGSLAAVRYYRDGTDITKLYNSAEQLSIPQAKTHHSGRYHCSADMHSFLSLKKRESQGLYVSVKELFTSPVLSVASSTEPLEGSPLNLSCITQLSPYRPHTVLWYLFYGNSTVLRGPTTSSEYQVPTVGLMDTGFYSCEVRTESSSVQKWSPQVPITIKRVPISGVSLDVWPQEGQVMEGQRLVLHCSVAVGTGSISFSWHREGSAEVLGRGRSYEIPSTQQSDNGQYYCMASNGDSTAQSLLVKVTVVGVSSLFCSRVRALLLPAALGTLLLGVVVVHVLIASSRAKRNEAPNASAPASVVLQERMFEAVPARAPRK